MLSIIRKLGVSVLRISVIVFLTLLFLEVVYRYQWIDFYSTEWKSLNPTSPDHSDKKVLVFGDSFSADPNSWVGNLRKMDTNVNYYNASLPGVGIETFRLIAEDRIAEVQPTHVLIQLYVGNDLYDYRKPVNWSELSIMRNVFWTAGSYLRVLNYLNYKSGQFSIESTNRSGKIDTLFSVEAYSPRTKLYIQSDATYPASTIHLKGGSAEVFAELIEGIAEMKEALEEELDFSILVIPHCTQVHSRYRKFYRLLGSNLNGIDTVGNSWAVALRDKGWRVLDPLEVLSDRENAGELVYFQNDPHLNEYGQKVLSQFIKGQFP